MFYYLLLAMVLAVLGLSRLLLRRRVGYYWLAIREDPAAGEALGINVFGYKLGAVALSAMLTAVAGGVMAFYNNNLYPDNVFTTASSVEIITAPFVGGIGTLFGPILGAFVLTGLGEAMTSVSAVFGVAGLKQWLLWRGAARHHRHAAGGPLALAPAPPRDRRGMSALPLLEVEGLAKRFRGLQAVEDVSFTVPQGGIVGLIGPNGAGKTTTLQSDRRRLPPRPRPRRARWPRHHRLAGPIRLAMPASAAPFSSCGPSAR